MYTNYTETNLSNLTERLSDILHVWLRRSNRPFHRPLNWHNIQRAYKNAEKVQIFNSYCLTYEKYTSKNIQKMFISTYW